MTAAGPGVFAAPARAADRPERRPAPVLAGAGTSGTAVAERRYPVTAARPQLGRASLPPQPRAAGNDAASERVPAVARGGRQGWCQGMGSRR